MGAIYVMHMDMGHVYIVLICYKKVEGNALLNLEMFFHQNFIV